MNTTTTGIVITNEDETKFFRVRDSGECEIVDRATEATVFNQVYRARGYLDTGPLNEFEGGRKLHAFLRKAVLASVKISVTVTRLK